MFCYVFAVKLLCFAMICYILLCFCYVFGMFLMCFAVLFHMFWHALLRFCVFVMFCYVLVCFVAMFCNVLLCFCYVLLYFAIFLICFAMFCYDWVRIAFIHHQIKAVPVWAVRLPGSPWPRPRPPLQNIAKHTQR